MLSLANLDMVFEPYPTGLATGVFTDYAYSALLEAWPEERWFATMAKRGYNKLSLSERFNPKEYHRVVMEVRPWRTFHDYIKSARFTHDVLSRLGFDLSQNVTARFEFSSLPADGGFIRPHRDIPSKIITLVIPMSAAWQPKWGGGTDILEPTEDGLVDYEADLDKFAILRTIPFGPNQAAVFVKTENSWHSVGPISGTPGIFRRSLTINIEKA